MARHGSRPPALGFGAPAGKPKLTEEERRLFREAVQDATPIKVAPRAAPAPVTVVARKPGASQRPGVAKAAADNHSGRIPRPVAAPALRVQDDHGSEPAWLRPAVGRDVLRKLRHGAWGAPARLDLHGMRAGEAEHRLDRFIDDALMNGQRVICVIHGKGLGSPGGEPVLRERVSQVLGHRADVLAFTPAPPAQGGTGALLVLLKRPRD